MAKSTVTHRLYFIFHPVRHCSFSMQSFNKTTMADQLVIFTLKSVYGSRLNLVYCITDIGIMIKTRFDFLVAVPYFKVNTCLRMGIFGALSAQPFGGFWPNLHRCIFRRFIRYGDIDSVSRSKGHWQYHSLINFSLSALYFFNQLFGSGKTIFGLYDMVGLIL